jgi:hypothetical protein
MMMNIGSTTWLLDIGIPIGLAVWRCLRGNRISEAQNDCISLKFVLIGLFPHENPCHLTSNQCFQYVFFHPDDLCKHGKSFDRAEV